MRSSRFWMKSSRVWMRSNQMVRAPGCQCQSRNSPGFDPSIFLYTEKSDGRQMKQCRITYEKTTTERAFYLTAVYSLLFGLVVHCRILPYCLQDRRIKPFFFRQHAILLLLQISQKLSVPFRHLLCYFKNAFFFFFLFFARTTSILLLPVSHKLSASLYSCIHQTKLVSYKKYLCFFSLFLCHFDCLLHDLDIGQRWNF
jgi:hypothetical protein